MGLNLPSSISVAEEEFPTPKSSSRAPRWYGIPLRVALITFVGTLLVFAVTLLIAIIATAIASAIRGIHPDMRIAYRMIAFPTAALAGVIILIASVVMEIRHYLKARDLSAENFDFGKPSKD